MTEAERALVEAIGDVDLTLNQRTFLRELRAGPERPLDDRARAYLARIADKAGVPVPEGFLGLGGQSPGQAGGPVGNRQSEELRPHPLAEIFPLMSGSEFADLVASMRAHGYRVSEPVVLLDGMILDGRNRYAAAREAELGPVFRDYDAAAEGPPVDYVLDLNLNRRHLDESQRAMVAAALASMGVGRPKKGMDGWDGSGHDAEDIPPIGGISAHDASRMLNVGERSIERARRVIKTGVADLQDAVRQGRASVSAAAVIAELPQDEQKKLLREIAAQPDTRRAFVATVKDLRLERQQEKRSARETREAELGQRQAALPAKRYGVILADPEWRFEPYSRESGMDRSADNHYPTSATAAIAARPVASIAADDCVLFLWATAPMLPDALSVMTAWGFQYKSQVVWGKAETRPAHPDLDLTHQKIGGLVLGPGYWFRNAHELLLVGTRGNVPAPAMGSQFPSIIFSRPRKHSEKPDWQYDLAEAYFPNLPKIELNARRARPGWDAWGLEAPGQEGQSAVGSRESDEPFDPETGEIIEPSGPIPEETNAAGAAPTDTPASEGGGGLDEAPAVTNRGDDLMIPRDLWRGPGPWPGDVPAADSEAA